MLKALLSLSLLACYAAAAEPTYAHMSLSVGEPKGEVYFNKTSDGIHVTGKITGLTAGLHGFHVHEIGELNGNCTNAKGHFNPFKKNHGAPNDTDRHVGDLGNIEADANGIAIIDIKDNVISLSGESSIIGRSIVIHADPDDLGRGGQEDSKTTGHAGARVACGTISAGERIFTSLPIVLIATAISSLTAFRF